MTAPLEDRRIGFTGVALAIVMCVLGGAAWAQAPELVTPAQVPTAGTETSFGGTFQVDVQTNVVTFVPPDAALRVGPDITVYDNVGREGDVVRGFGTFVSQNPVHGDLIRLTQPGEIRELFLHLYKDRGPLFSGTFRVQLYDAVGWGGVGYPATQIFSRDFTIDFVTLFGTGGLPDLERFQVRLFDWPEDVRVPRDILVTQQLVSYDGDPTFIGVYITGSRTPYTGSSDPNSAFFGEDGTSPQMFLIPGQLSNNLEYSVKACTTTEIQVSTDTINVSADVGQQTLYVDRLTISNENGCVPLEYSIVSNCGISTPPGTVPAGGVAFVDLLYDTAGIPPGTQNGIIQLLSNDFALPVVIIPVTYTVTCLTGAPDVQVSPETILASGPLGQVVALIDALTISNEFGCVPLEYQITSDCGLSSPPGTVPTGGVSTINLSYRPFGKAPGTYSGLLTVTTNDPVTPTATVPVTYTVTGTINDAVPGLAYAAQGPTASARWVAIDLTTGAGTDLGFMGFGVPGLATTADGSIIAGGLNDDIWQIDSATGALVNVADSVCLRAMASGDDLVLGLGCDDVLYAIDPATGLLEELLLTGVDPLMGGLAVDLQTFTFYFSQADTGPGTDNLYAWELFSGEQAVLKGSLGLGLPIGDIACDASGNLYGVVGEPSGPTYLVSIDKDTGAATVIGETGINDLDALVIYGLVPTGVPELEIPTPTAYVLHGATPNPFNPATEISFELPRAGSVQLSVYDVSGRLVSTLVDEEMPAGSHSVRFMADELASGTYFYELRAPGYRESRKMTLVK